MRLGKLVKTFGDIVPIPRALSYSFGIEDGHELYIVPIRPVNGQSSSGYEIVVSPIPASSWASVCRLSVRIKNESGVLIHATNFLKEMRINIFIIEAAVTFLDRAHWDAVCDLKHYAPYINLYNLCKGSPNEEQMAELIHDLNKKFSAYTSTGHESSYYLDEADYGKRFSLLTGLNRISRQCDLRSAVPARIVNGSFSLPTQIMATLQMRCEQNATGPLFISRRALLTGSTEQRYIRILFLFSEANYFSCAIDYDITGFVGDGLGVINQIISTMPDGTNILQLSNASSKNSERQLGMLNMIAYLCKSEQSDEDFSRVLGERINSLELCDADGACYPEKVKVRGLNRLRTAEPRVFISYSIDGNYAWLSGLQKILAANGFEVILGTESEDSDVVASSLGMISSCVAFFSLATRKTDCKLSRRGSYAYPPWLIIEEERAHTANIKFICRLIQDGVEDNPRGNVRRHRFSERNFDDILKFAFNSFVGFTHTLEFRDECYLRDKSMYRYRQPRSGQQFSER